MTNKIIKIEEKRVNMRVIFRILQEYKLSILFFAILFSFTVAIWVYFQSDIYETSTTIEVGIDNRHLRDTIIAQSKEGNSFAINTEIGIIKSRFLAEHALQKVDFTHRYYTRRGMKEKELYKNIPFDLNLTKGKQISFYLYPLDEDSYRLKVNDGSIDYDQVVYYGQEVKNDIFQLKIRRNKNINISDSAYRFIVLDDSASIEYVVKNTTVSQFAQNSALIQITYQDVDPLRAKEYANALASTYIEQSIYQKTREASKILKFVDHQLLEINNNLKYFAGELEKFKVRTISLDAKAKSIVETIGNIQINLSQWTMEEELLNSLYKQMKKGKNIETLSLVGLGGDNFSYSSLSSLLKNLQASVLKIKLLRADYTEEYPEVKKLQQQINQLKNIAINTIKSMKNNIAKRKLLIEKSMKEQQVMLQHLPQNEREYGRIERKLVMNEKIYSYLLEQRSAAAIAKASTVKKNRILDRAWQPMNALSPKRQKSIIIALILGLLFGIVYAFIRAFINEK